MTSPDVAALIQRAAQLEEEQDAIGRIVPPKFKAGILVERVQLLVVQHQHDDGRCRVWEQEAIQADASRVALVSQLRSLTRQWREQARKASRDPSASVSMVIDCKADEIEALLPADASQEPTK